MRCCDNTQRRLLYELSRSLMLPPSIAEQKCFTGRYSTTDFVTTHDGRSVTRALPWRCRYRRVAVAKYRSAPPRSRLRHAKYSRFVMLSILRFSPALPPTQLHRIYMGIWDIVAALFYYQRIMRVIFDQLPRRLTHVSMPHFSLLRLRY